MAINAANHKRMYEAGRELKELVVADTLDLARIQKLHGAFIAARNQYRAECEEMEAARQQKLREERERESQRRAEAEQMTKQELVTILRADSKRWTRQQLIDQYARS